MATNLRYPQPIVIQQFTLPQYCIIWLHGLGATGDDFAGVANMFVFDTHVRYVFPHAAKQAVSINNGMVMPSWYDIYETAINRRVDQPGVAASAAYIYSLADQQNAQGIADKNIIIAGFSQGGALALHCGLNGSRSFAAIIALACYCIQSTHIQTTTPVFIGHGTADDVVPFELGLAARDTLQAHGNDVTFQQYQHQHTVSQQQLNDVENWLRIQIDTP